VAPRAVERNEKIMPDFGDFEANKLNENTRQNEGGLTKRTSQNNQTKKIFLFMLLLLVYTNIK
jgi:hypothetical protein